MADPAEPNVIRIYGLIAADSFKHAQLCAKELALSASKYFAEPIIVKMFEFEWDHFIEEQKKKLRGEMWIYSHDELIFINDELIGSCEELLTWAQNNVAFEDDIASPLYSVLTEEDYKNQLKETNHELMYMYISIDKEPQGHFLIELFNDILPKTCENFKTLCLGYVTETKRLLTYQDTIFHRIVPNGWIQGGDVLIGNGSDGVSIYGDVFEDENFAVPHNKRGILGMANHGRHTNNSQFYITLTATPWMNYKYVAFGQLLEGTELLNKIAEESTINEHPINTVVITKCVMLDFEEPLDDNLPDFSFGLEEAEETQENVAEHVGITERNAPKENEDEKEPQDETGEPEKDAVENETSKNGTTDEGDIQDETVEGEKQDVIET